MPSILHQDKHESWRAVDRWKLRVDGADWGAITDEVNEYGGALLPQPSSSDEATKFGRPAPSPETLDEWPDMCHEAGAVKSSAMLLPYGHGYLSTTRDRTVKSARGWSAAPVHHVVSAVRSGERHTLALVLRDAA